MGKQLEAIGSGLLGGSIGVQAKFIVKVNECDEYVTSGLLVAFDGPSEPDIKFNHLKNGNVEVSYLPKVPGNYRLTVKYNDKHIRGSPFRCEIAGVGVNVKKPKVIKRNLVHKVKLSGPNTSEAKVNEKNFIYLDISKAEISYDVMVDSDGPARLPVLVEEREYAIITLEYTPTRPGTYNMRLSIRGEKIPGTPLTITAT